MFSDRFLLFIPFLKFEKSHADTREQSILEKVEWLSIRSQKKNRKSQFYSQRKIWKMARNHDLISLNMIGMTSALIAWLLPFWSKGTYHNFSFNSHASFSLGGLRLLKTYIPENFWDIRKVDDRSGTGYYLSGAIQTCWMNADHRIRFWPKNGTTVIPPPVPDRGRTNVGPMSDR